MFTMFTTNIHVYAYMKFEHQISEKTYIGLETEGLYCFRCTTLNFGRKNADNCNAIIMSRKMERESPKVIDVYTEAIFMHALHF